MNFLEIELYPIHNDIFGDDTNLGRTQFVDIAAFLSHYPFLELFYPGTHPYLCKSPFRQNCILGCPSNPNQVAEL